MFEQQKIPSISGQRIQSIDLDSSRDDECPICYIGLTNSRTIKTSPCNHTFHLECLSRWIQNRVTCGYCITCGYCNTELSERFIRSCRTDTDASNLSFYGRTCRFLESCLETTPGTLIAGTAILIGVGAVGVLIALIPLSLRNVTAVRKVPTYCADSPVNKALVMSARAGDIENLELLIKNGADIDCVGNFGGVITGFSLLEHAIVWERKIDVPALLKAGASPNFQSNSGRTALHFALRYVAVKISSALC